MHRFYLPPPASCGSEFELLEADARHALSVLRIRVGEPVTVMDGAGAEVVCEVVAVAKRSVKLRAMSRRIYSRPPARVTVAQAIAKTQAMDGVVHRAVELGCAAVVPLLGERSVSRPREADEKGKRWRSIAIEAVKQCGAPWLAEIEAPVKPVEFARRLSNFDLAILASLAPGARPVRAVIEERFRNLGRSLETVAVLVGPEGDFSTAEHDALVAGGAAPVSLGPWVLRVETAAVAAVALTFDALSCPPAPGK